jgi:predicted TIM-barrel fold metal-dependent hydrolase
VPHCEHDVPIVDFHSHYIAPAWRPTSSTAHGWPLLTDLDGQLEAASAAGIDGQVLSVPPANLTALGEQLAPGCVQRINDDLADLVAAHPGRLLALATIDAFQGNVAAREVERVVGQLGFGGLVVDCALAGALLDASAARPALDAAAALGAVVFVLPVSPAGLTERYGALGSAGVLLARGVETSASMLALLRADVLDDLPNLRVVIPAIGAPALIFAALADREHGHAAVWRGTLPSQARRRLTLVTTGLDPALLRFAVGLLGVEQVLFGSDWPRVPLVDRACVLKALNAAGVTAGDDQAAILAGNTLRLLTRCVCPADGRQLEDLREHRRVAPALTAPTQLGGEADWDWVVR